MYNIIKEIENEIIDAINPIIEQYIQGRTFGTSHAKNVISRDDYDSYFDNKKKTIFDAKKEFLKNKNIRQLIKDIDWIGYRNFAKLSGIGESNLSEQRYIELVKKLLIEVIEDRIALEKDKKIMENIKSFESFYEIDDDDIRYAGHIVLFKKDGGVEIGGGYMTEENLNDLLAYYKHTIKNFPYDKKVSNYKKRIDELKKILNKLKDGNTKI